MARKLRIQYPGAIYHIVSRGDHRERIFKDDRDRQRFLDTLGESCAKTNLLVHARGQYLPTGRLGDDLLRRYFADNSRSAIPAGN